MNKRLNREINNMPSARPFRSTLLTLFWSCLLFSLSVSWVFAHHVLGRPSYSLSEDSNTPPSMQVETQIGKYYVTYMVFPAFPKPNEPGRVNLYIRRIKDGTPFQGKVDFYILDDTLFSSKTEKIGTQSNDDNVYRQGFVFKQQGQFLVRAKFKSMGEPYTIDFPLTIGNPWPLGVLSSLAIGFIVILVLLNLLIRKKVQRAKLKQHQVELKT